ncbi:hypothetical protein GII30_14580 [Gordonia amarae]|uniref:Uncharacterized protein n=2 Tax=Gordonia amarae TaxID=36821 RepID=G7GPT7_9ACTN|nr:hypothetical protein [Gordonia amarae]MCS3879629.1 hypothetical protein [Gordonia amarae]QHN18078.1 hypothetical protein GII35_14895 [Gordonia amarae]QHN22599.1 hypothetical protein GII34_14635 [Gordonia amarae]QHN31465.1 hypothetical protein GII32_14745 [Gordonia amarae]QHN40209.1 hypothetical protein GII30_14580 [Gordonia amarae]
MNRTTGAAVLALACSAALTGCMSDDSGQRFSLSGGTSVQIQVPGGWQARDLDGTVLLTPKGDDRDLSALTDALTTTQLGSSSRGANYLTVTGVRQCDGKGKWVWSVPERTNSGVRTGEVRRKTDGGCVAVRAGFAQGSGDDSANTAEAGPPAVDLLKKIVDGEIVTAD